MDQLEISPNKRLGQNFLIGDYVVNKILERVKLVRPDFIIEVGPGLGALTTGLNELLGHSQNLLLIELDRRLAKWWREQNFKVVEDDALKVDWEMLKLPPRSCLVSNLPYQISASLVVERSLYPAQVGAMVLMFQKEVAKRITASQTDEDYGFLSVVAQTFWDLDFVVEAGPNEFYPAPKIASRVLAFSAKANPGFDRRLFVDFLRAAFTNRRKQVLKSLISYAQKFGRTRQDVVNTMQACGIDVQARAEQISVASFSRLFTALQSEGSKD